MRGNEDEPPTSDEAAILAMKAGTSSLVVDWRLEGGGTNLVVSLDGERIMSAEMPASDWGWGHVAISISNTTATLCVNSFPVASCTADVLGSFLAASVSARLGAWDGARGRSGVEIGELLFWNRELSPDEIFSIAMANAHDGCEDEGLSGCYVFKEGVDRAVTGNDYRTFTEKIIGIPYTAYNCLSDENGPVSLDWRRLTPIPARRRRCMCRTRRGRTATTRTKSTPLCRTSATATSSGRSAAT